MPNRYEYPRTTRALIFKGFISERIELAGVNLEVKSLNTNEVSEIDDRFEGPDRLSAYLAWSLVRVDGLNTLQFRASSREEELLDFATGMPNYVLVRLVDVLVVLNRWATFELHNIIRFALEPESKIAWRSLKGHTLNDPKLTGLPGTDRLGLGDHQQLWVYHNEMAHEEWIEGVLTDMAIFVASPMAGKSIRPVVARRRMARLRVNEWEKQVREGTYLKPTSPADDLLGLLDREMAGRKDEFDRAVIGEELQAKSDTLKGILRRRLSYERIHAASPEVILGEPEGPFDPAVFARQAIQKINEVGKYMEPLELDETALAALIEELRREIGQQPLAEVANAERNAHRHSQ